MMAQCAPAMAFHENRRQQIINQHEAISRWCGDIHDIRKVSVEILDHDYNVNLINKNLLLLNSARFNLFQTTLLPELGIYIRNTVVCCKLC